MFNQQRVDVVIFQELPGKWDPQIPREGYHAKPKFSGGLMVQWF